MQPSITRRRLLAVAGVSAVGGAVLPRLSGTAYDPSEQEAWNHPRADPGNTAAVSLSGITGEPELNWTRQFNPSDLFRFRGFTHVDDLLLVPAHDRLRALSTDTGDTQWTVTLPTDRREHQQLDSAPNVHDDKCILASLASVYAVDVRTGRPRWRYDLSSSTDGLILLGNTAYVSAQLNGGDRLIALDATSGRERWQSDGRWIPLAATEDMVLVQSDARKPNDSRLAAFDPETGVRRWTTDEPLETRRFRELRDGVAVADDTVFITDDGSLLAVDARTGEHRWSRSLDGESSTYLDRLAVGDDVYVVQPDVNRVVCVSTTGDPLWDRELPGTEHGVSVGGEYVYVARRAGMTMLEPETGETAFSIDAAETPGHSWTPVVDDGVVYGIAGNTVYRVDTQ